MQLIEFIQLFAWPLLALLLVSLTAPAVGAFLHARGTAFHGVALPQVAAFGVAVCYALPLGGHPTRATLLVAAAIAVVTASLILGLLGRRAPAEGSSHVAALFAIASGGTVLASQVSPHGGLHVDALLSGETLSTGGLDVAILGVVAAIVLVVVLTRWRAITLMGADPEAGRASGLSFWKADALLHAAVCLVVIAGSLSVGALPMFALLVIPPLAAKIGAHSMRGFLIASTVIGALSATTGAAIAFQLDISMDASVVAGSVLLALLEAVRVYFFAGRG